MVYGYENTGDKLQQIFNFTGFRDFGAVFYDRKKYINTSARLVGNDSLSKDIWKSNGPIIDFDDKPHEFTLDDLEMPYSLYKKKNSDTINVIKDGFELKFLMPGSRK